MLHTIERIHISISHKDWSIEFKKTVSWEQCLLDCALDGFHLAGLQADSCACISQSDRFELTEVPVKDRVFIDTNCISW